MKPITSLLTPLKQLLINHFSTKNKKYYMYKHVIGEKTIKDWDYFIFSHLNEKSETYLEFKDNQIRNDMLIVQGIDYEDRSKKV